MRLPPHQSIAHAIWEWQLVAESLIMNGNVKEHPAAALATTRLPAGVPGIGASGCLGWDSQLRRNNRNRKQRAKYAKP
jgi:hypothetical protein